MVRRCRRRVPRPPRGADASSVSHTSFGTPRRGSGRAAVINRRRDGRASAALPRQIPRWPDGRLGCLPSAPEGVNLLGPMGTSPSLYAGGLQSAILPQPSSLANARWGGFVGTIAVATPKPCETKVRCSWALILCILSFLLPRSFSGCGPRCASNQRLRRRSELPLRSAVRQQLGKCWMPGDSTKFASSRLKAFSRIITIRGRRSSDSAHRSTKGGTWRRWAWPHTRQGTRCKTRATTPRWQSATRPSRRQPTAWRSARWISLRCGPPVTSSPDRVRT